MRESDFSQVVVKADDGANRLVTREGIARWLEANIEEELVHLGDVTLADIFAHENPESYTYAARSDALPEIMELFANSVAKLRAVLITENGKSHETPLKIVTPWDLHDHVM